MVDDYARATGQPAPILLDGKEYRVGKLRPVDLGRLQAWLKTKVPNPLELVRPHMDGLPDEVAKHVWTLAYEEFKRWPPQFGDEATIDLLVGAEGQAEFLLVALGRYLPGFTRADAEQLVERIELDDFMAVMALAMPGAVGDPKAPAKAAQDDSPTPRSEPASA